MRAPRNLATLFLAALPLLGSDLVIGAARAGEPLEIRREVKRRCWADQARVRGEMEDLRKRLTHPAPGCDAASFALTAEGLSSREDGGALTAALAKGKLAQFAAPGEQEFRTGFIEAVLPPADGQPLLVEIRELATGQLYRLDSRTTSEVYVYLNEPLGKAN